MILSKMTQAEYDAWFPRSRELFTQSKMKGEGLTQEQAEKVSESSFSRLLPEGYNSKDQHLFIARDSGGTELGFIWFAVQNGVKAYIYDVEIYEQFRGKGYGRKIMQLAELEAKKLGLTKMGLHVFGYNTPAISLYESLGYSPTNIVMEKPL